MKKEEYLKVAFDAYNANEIDAETYDCMLINADIFCDEEREE